MSKAWDLDLPATPKLVFLALCDSADDTTRQCYPSLQTIMTKAGVSKANLSYVLRAFESIGALSRDNRQRKNGGDTSTLYTINHFDIDAESFKKEYQRAKGYNKRSDVKSEHANTRKEPHTNTETPQSEHGGSSLSEHPKHPKVNTPQTPQSEHGGCSLSEHATYNEPSNISLNRHSKEVAVEVVDDFDTFWSAYPNKVGKANAKKAWSKKKPDIDTVLRAINMQQLTHQWSKNNGRFIPHPTTWLNGERWNDEVQLSDAEKSMAITDVGGVSAIDQLKVMGVG